MSFVQNDLCTYLNLQKECELYANTEFTLTLTPVCSHAKAFSELNILIIVSCIKKLWNTIKTLTFL